MKKENQLVLFSVEPIEKVEPQVCAGNFPIEKLKSVLDAAHKGIGKEYIFSSGTDADNWLYRNCNQCKVSNGDNKRAQAGLDCIGEYAVSSGFITGAIPESVVTHFGIGGSKCKQFK